MLAARIRLRVRGSKEIRLHALAHVQQTPFTRQLVLEQPASAMSTVPVFTRLCSPLVYLFGGHTDRFNSHSVHNGARATSGYLSRRLINDAPHKIVLLAADPWK